MTGVYSYTHIRDAQYMTFKKCWGILPFCFVITAHANEMSYQSHNYFVSISGGLNWTNAGSTQTIALQPDIIKTYAPKNLSNSNVMESGEIFLGIQKCFCEHVRTQLGVAVYFNSFAKLNGYIQEDDDLNFQNYSYQYKINHQHIALKAKGIYENAFNMNPYLSASLGVGLNRSYDYSSNPLISQEVSAPPFQAHTKVAFSYSLGAGFQHTVNQRMTVAVGYQLVSWGSSALNAADGQTSGRGLSLSNLYTQGIEFNVSYFI